MSPQILRAAQYVLDHPSSVVVQSMGALAKAAEVKPNTLVRLVKTLDFASYAGFRARFRERVCNGLESFPDRARWLQTLARANSHGQLFSQMAAAGSASVEQVFSTTSAAELKASARSILGSRPTLALGLGTCFALAYGFWQVARMALTNLVPVPSQGTLPFDDVARMEADDVLLAMSFDPYRTEIVQAVRLAKAAGGTVISVTDSHTLPLALGADHVCVVPTRTPQFFPSMVAADELLETLTAFIIAEREPSVDERISEFHRCRLASGVYYKGER